VSIYISHYHFEEISSALGVEYEYCKFIVSAKNETAEKAVYADLPYTIKYGRRC